ncbi:pseudouridine synthase Rsu [Hallella multisaccharivorax DSM 17128]|uniref:Pseudouridine synthase n=2 Tax=Hallella multisaccharivorax TaxID=310514 RepID=F8N7Q8_9BACT|nr:pseudouridine synthase Rsu [Hallella multisaccharivorax DSM 17128]
MDQAATTMSEEQEKMETAQEPQKDAREGFARNGGHQNQRDYNPGTGRTQRPRIHTTFTRSQYGNHTSDAQPADSGFRPEGFGAALGTGSDQPRQQGYQPRQGGYQPRQQGGYQPRQQGGYQPRPRFNNGEGGYQPRQQGGYQPRPRFNNGEGGYQSHQQGGYQPRPRFNNGEGDYQSRQQGGYQPRRQGGYQPRQQGGYQPRQQSGYQPRQQSGYQPRQQGNGFRGGYNNGYRSYNNAPRPGYDPNAKYSLKKRIEYKEEHVDPEEPIRLNKYLANAGVCSRREADEFITSGVVTVNGTVVTELGTKVKRSDEVHFRDQPVTIEKKVYILLNKPKDYVTTSDDPQQRKTVMDLVKDACPERIYPVGRLDRNTTGVLLLTNDGELASKLTHPKFLKKKVYHVFLDKNVTTEDLQKIADGIELEDGEVHADAIEYADERDHSQVGIEIHSGRNRIVRRIFEYLGYRVVKLDRVQFAGLTKKNLRRGDWRFLTEKEVDTLRSGMFE